MTWRWKADFFPWTAVAKVPATVDWAEDVSNKPDIASPTDVTDAATAAKLAADGLDAISVVPPTGVATNFREMLVQLWRRWFRKTDRDLNENLIRTYADDGTTVLTAQPISDTGGVETLNAATEPE